MLRGCSLADQGLLINLMCIAAGTENPGYLVQGNEPIPDKLIARLVAIRPQTYRKGIANLVATRRLMQTNEGVYYIPRMVKDAEYSRKQSKHGSLGGNPTLKGKADQTLKPEYSNSNSNSNSNKKAKGSKRVSDHSPGFVKFWEAYPKREKKREAWRIWQRDKLEPETDSIVAAVERHKVSAKWTDDEGKYINLPSTYLNGSLWLDELPPAKNLAAPPPWRVEEASA